MNRNVQTFLGCDAPYEQADIVLFGAPFDGTTSFRPGARFGPAAIRADSVGLETYSPYCDRDLTGLRVCDVGDLETPFGNAEKALTMIERRTAEILDAGKKPFMLGGEHLVTLGAMRAVCRRYPDVRVLHLDAHTDLRGDYLGEPFSHACVIRRVWELIGDGRIHQFAIRSGEKDEFSFAERHTRMHRFSLSGWGDTLADLGNAPVYPGGTGSPRPGSGPSRWRSGTPRCCPAGARRSRAA
jgi:agmatinase